MSQFQTSWIGYMNLTDLVTPTMTITCPVEPYKWGLTQTLALPYRDKEVVSWKPSARKPISMLLQV